MARPKPTYVSVRVSRDEVKKEHIIIAETLLGRRLPAGACVHHVNGDGEDNSHSNLVVCPSEEYHQLLHIRTRALNESGDADNRKCMYCSEYDSQTNLKKWQPRTRTTPIFYHKRCRSEYRSQKCRTA